jgi:asparagine synthase (glutamine-hydrolysing)
MCGIVGYFTSESIFDPALAGKMAKCIESRGPDDSGVWLDQEAGLALAHRRLSIIDLSPAGHQPMLSPCGRYVVIYNGEIYNHKELRKQLEKEGGHFDWRGHSDTETLLAALRHWEISDALTRLNGMFAFALWDRHERSLFLARDRMGIKPLYYGVNIGVFLFGSELKALTAHPKWRGEVDRNALALYLRYNYVPMPYCIYHGLAKLPPAHFVVVRENGRSISEPKCYWDLGQIARQGPEQAQGSAVELIDELEKLLGDAVNKRMVADVPLGAFLSGGYDSSTVTALMQAQSDRPIRTFSIGFHEQVFDEARHAKAVAKYLGTEHTEMYVSPDEARAVIPELPSIWDEPFSDSSQIPTYLLSQLTRQHVTVSLSGDGGDELFAGYNRYLLGYRAWNKLRVLPLKMRKALGWVTNHAPGHKLEHLQRLLPQRLRVPELADRLPKLAEVLVHRDGQSFYRDLVSHWKTPEDIVHGAKEPETLLADSGNFPALPEMLEYMMYLDMKTYLPDDILTKVDRASMAVSLEARVPILDHRVVEFAWQVPSEYKYRAGRGKWLLRQVLYRYVPRELMDRPKQGFAVPIEHWLRGPLHGWGEELLNENRLREEGFFDPSPIRRMWHEHVSGKRRWHYHLWAVLMFQAWLEEQRI